LVVSRPPDHAGSHDKTDPDDTGRVVDASCRQIEPAFSNDILRDPRTATFAHQHEPPQVRQVRPGKVVERGPLTAPIPVSAP
jgi:hypothetical protein